MKISPVVLLVFACWWVVGFCRADSLELNDDPTTLYGLVVADSTIHAAEGEIVFGVFDVSQSELLMRTFDRANIKRLVVTIDQPRLEALRLDELSGYRDLAEELASLKHDEYARDLAIRLNLCCIYHGYQSQDQTAVIKSAARNLVHLARDAGERSRFQLWGQLYAGLPLHQDETVVSQRRLSGQWTPADQQLRLEMLQSLRRENFSQAREQAESILRAQDVMTLPDSGATFSLATRYWVRQMRNAATVENIVSHLLCEIIRQEIEIRYAVRDDTPFDDSTLGLAETHGWLSAEPTKVIPIENGVRFDLEASCFRTGRWIRPGSDIQTPGG